MTTRKEKQLDYFRKFVTVPNCFCLRSLLREHLIASFQISFVFEVGAEIIVYNTLETAIKITECRV